LESSEPSREPAPAEPRQRERSQRDKFAALLTVSRAVVNSLDLNTILSTIAKQIREVIQTDECTVFLHDEREHVLVPAVCDAKSYVEEMMAVRLRLGEGITGTVAVTGRGEIVNDAEADPRAMSVPGTPPEQSALLCVPLISRDHVLGVITLSRLGMRGFQEDDLELATLFAGQCSAAIANARLYESMKLAYDELRATQVQLVQSAKLNALGEMAGGVAHDFNNILAAILGRTQLLLQTVEDPDLRRQLGVVEQAALDGAQTVRRVQEFTRVRQDERFETVDLNRILYGVVELTRPAWEAGAKRRGVVVNVHLDLRASLTIAGAASELREVFTNMVLNAVDAMPAGGELWIASSDEGGRVRVQVRDTGVGMDHETRARIFDPFFTTKEVKGTGLGLSVAYGIVNRHHGQIEVHSSPGGGTVFTLVFPAGAIPTAQASAPDGPAPSSLRVLVVDDEESVLSVLAEMLRGAGHHVTTALGGLAAIEVLRGPAFDVVFTDLGMPEVNGWDLASLVKARRPECAVVLVSGWGFQLEEEAAHSRGVDLVLAKPFSFSDVEVSLRALFQPDGTRRRAA
jgi:signal transduction histidine kinase/CheY-like chemotaxis protein